MANPWEKYQQQGPGIDPRIASDVTIQGNKAEASAYDDDLARDKLANSASDRQLDREKFEFDKARQAADLAKEGLQMLPDGSLVPLEGGKVGARKDNSNRIAQIESILSNIDQLRGQANDWMAVGKQSGNVAEWPLVGGVMGQNRADVEGILQMLEGDMIQQQLAEMSKNNAGKGVATLANSENEAKRIAASIANLSPDQSYDQFMQGVDRAEQYYTRQLQNLAGEAGQDIGRQAGGEIGSAPTRQVPPTVDQTQQRMVQGRSGSVAPSQSDFETVANPKLAGLNSEVNQMLMDGKTTQQIAAHIKSRGSNPIPYLGAIDQNVKLQARARRGEIQVAQPFIDVERMSREISTPKKISSAILDSHLGAAGAGMVNATTLGYSDDIAEALGAEDADQTKAYLRDQYAGSTLAGEIGGSLIGLKGAGSAIKRLGGKNTAKTALASDVAYGTAYGSGEMDDNRLLGAGIGAGSTLLGNQIGSRVIAPLAQKPANALANKARGMFGAKPVALTAKPDKTLGMVVSRTSDDTLAKLKDAQNLGLPMSIADTNPQLRTLAGSAVRKSPAAREFAENVIEPRAVGQADRAQEAIASHLTAPVDPKAVSAQIRRGAQDASRPFYEALEGKAAPVNDDLAAMLENPAIQGAYGDAVAIAQNEGRDPLKLGFDFNEAGDVVGVQNPSWETLDFIKKGIDAKLQPFRDPFGRLQLEGNPMGQSLESLRQRYVSTLDNLPNSADYKAARGAYSDAIAPRAGLGMGNDAFASRVPVRDVQSQLGRLTPEQNTTYQQGFATRMADQVDNTKMGGDPYKSIYGSTAQHEKTNAIFPGNNFGRVAEMEKDMAKTAYETLGGSPTAARGATDQLFDGGGAAGNVAEVGLSAATGVPPVNAIMQGAKNFGMDSVRLGLGKNSEKRAAAIAPTLLNTNPATGIDFINDALAQKAAYELQRTRARRVGGMFGTPLAIGALGQSQ